MQSLTPALWNRIKSFWSYPKTRSCVGEVSHSTAKPPGVPRAAKRRAEPAEEAGQPSPKRCVLSAEEVANARQCIVDLTTERLTYGQQIVQMRKSYAMFCREYEHLLLTYGQECETQAAIIREMATACEEREAEMNRLREENTSLKQQLCFAEEAFTDTCNLAERLMENFSDCVNSMVDLAAQRNTDAAKRQGELQRTQTVVLNKFKTWKTKMRELVRWRKLQLNRKRQLEKQCINDSRSPISKRSCINPAAASSLNSPARRKAPQHPLGSQTSRAGTEVGAPSRNARASRSYPKLSPQGEPSRSSLSRSAARSSRSRSQPSQLSATVRETRRSQVARRRSQSVAPSDSTDVFRDQRSQGHRDQLAQGHRYQLAQGHRDQPSQGHRDQLAQGHRDQLAQGHRDQLVQGHRDQPSQGHRDQLAQGPRDQLAQGHRDQLAQGHRDQIAQGHRDQLAQGHRDQRSQGHRDQLTQSRKDQPLEMRSSEAVDRRSCSVPRADSSDFRKDQPSQGRRDQQPSDGHRSQFLEPRPLQAVTFSRRSRSVVRADVHRVQPSQERRVQPSQEHRVQPSQEHRVQLLGFQSSQAISRRSHTVARPDSSDVRRDQHSQELRNQPLEMRSCEAVGRRSHSVARVSSSDVRKDQPSQGHRDQQPSDGHRSQQSSDGHRDQQPSQGHRSQQPSQGHRSQQPSSISSLASAPLKTSAWVISSQPSKVPSSIITTSSENSCSLSGLLPSEVEEVSPEESASQVRNRFDDRSRLRFFPRAPMLSLMSRFRQTRVTFSPPPSSESGISMSRLKEFL